MGTYFAFTGIAQQQQQQQQQQGNGGTLGTPSAQGQGLAQAQGINTQGQAVAQGQGLAQGVSPGQGLALGYINSIGLFVRPTVGTSLGVNGGYLKPLSPLAYRYEPQIHTYIPEQHTRSTYLLIP